MTDAEHRQMLLATYKPPFQCCHGYIVDADGKVFIKFGIKLGRGQLIAEMLTQHWER